MNSKSLRLLPLEPQDWAPGLEKIKTALGKPLNIHNIMANHPALIEAWMPFRDHVVKSNSLQSRHLELLILRPAVNCGADYEWQHHVVRGRIAGLSDEEIQRVRVGCEAPQWSEQARVLLLAADDCYRDGQISDTTYTELEKHFDQRQQLDMIVTVGMYMTLANIIKTFRLPLEDDDYMRGN